MKRLALALALVWGLGAHVAWGQAATAALPLKPLTYEIVSVKVNKSETGGMSWNMTPDGIRMVNVRLRELVLTAYDLHNATDEQVTGMPKWAEDKHFDVEAKVSEDDLEAYKELKYDDRAPLLLAALQERFKLRAHIELHDLPIYSLVVAKSGPKFKPAEEGNTYANGLKFNGKAAGPGSMSINVSGTSNHAEFQATSLENLVSNLTMQVSRQVQDNTGLTGKYDFKLDWSSEDAKDPALPGIFTALEDQLGLKLVPAKGPVECVVVDHVEEPTEN
jgi:uncharacterized protein (TIGR03435 family)